MRRIIVAMTAALTLAACTIDSYDTGTGKYSLTRADFVEAHSDAEGSVDYIITDSGERLTLLPRVSADWIITADSLYRATIYYNKVSDTEAEPINLSSVPTLLPTPAEKFEDGLLTDPVTLESLWVSTGGRWLNIGFYLKVGQIGEDARLHTIGLIDEGSVTNPDGTVTARLRLYHDQGDVPEYYSSKYYVSIPCAAIAADSAAIIINTYDGPAERRLRIP